MADARLHLARAPLEERHQKISNPNSGSKIDIALLQGHVADNASEILSKLPNSGCVTLFTERKRQYQVFRAAWNMPSVLLALCTARNSMTSSEGPSPEPLLKKEASPAVLRGERILEML